MKWLWAVFLLTLCLSAAAQEPPPLPGEDLVILENDLFIITGKDYPSVQTVRQMTEPLQELGETYFGGPDRLQRQVLVQLVPEGEYTAPTAYTLAPDALGLLRARPPRVRGVSRRRRRDS